MSRKSRPLSVWHKIGDHLIWLALALSLIILSVGSSAHAALGAKASSVETDRRLLNAKVARTQDHGVTSHVLSAAGGIVSREYSTSDGTVFAVAWSGPMRPNLRQLMGAYYPRFQAVTAGSRRMRLRRGMAVADLDFIARSTGHPGHFQGYAYLPAAVPAGFDLNTLTEQVQ